MSRHTDDVGPVPGGQYARFATSFERAERNQKIVAARLRGFGEHHVAETHGVSERHVRRVLQEYRKSHRPLHQLGPSEALRDTLDAYQALIDEAVALADEAQQESTRLGALKLRLALLNARLRMFPGIGLVPSEVHRARLEADFTRIARQMLIILVERFWRLKPWRTSSRLLRPAGRLCNKRFALAA